MSAEPPLINPPPPKRRLGCIARLAIGLLVSVVVGALLLFGFGVYWEHRETNALIERATAALLANDAATALTALHQATLSRPDDVGLAKLYGAAQEKWIASIDQQIADLTPAQRYSILREDPVHRLRSHLSEPLATTFQQFIDRNMVDTQAQIQEAAEWAMDLVVAGKTSDGWKEMETLRVSCYDFPGFSELQQDFNAANTARLLIHAGDLGQHEQIADARELLEWTQKNRQPAPEALDEARFRIDLGDYSLHLLQAVNAATKGDQKTAEARIEEAKPLLSHLLANPELQNFYADLPAKDRGTPLIDQLNAAQFVVRKISANAPGR
jgi:hypothetical protein